MPGGDGDLIARATGRYGIVGLDDMEADAIIEALADHITRPEFVCRLPLRRLMHRTVLAAAPAPSLISSRPFVWFNDVIARSRGDLANTNRTGDLSDGGKSISDV